jgi:cis-3-alkyl-4-acyloxetan-2-one decarboxylase
VIINNIDISKFEHLYPFTPHFLDLGGIKYHYLDEGQGDPVIMLHGNPTWSFYFRNLVKSLAPTHRVIVPDHIGCGLSDKPSPREYGYRLENRVEDLERLVDHLELREKMTLVVHDWGGAVGLAFAVRRPHRIGRLVILNTAAFFPPQQQRIPIRLWLIRNIRTLATPAVLGLNLFAGAALYMATRKGLSKDVKAGLIAPYNSWKNRMATLKFVQDIPLAKGDPSYSLVETTQDHLHLFKNIPMLICWGDHDFVFDASYLAEWRRRFPDAVVHTFAQAGHYVLEDAAGEIPPLIDKFLADNPLG